MLGVALIRNRFMVGSGQLRSARRARLSGKFVGLLSKLPIRSYKSIV